jgi:hypothetical protein
VASDDQPPQTKSRIISAAWSETNRPSLEQKVVEADLIILARIKGSRGSRLQNTELKDQHVLWGKAPKTRTLVLLIRETRFRYAHGPDPEWIFFIEGPHSTQGDYEFRYLVGENYDYLGMEPANPETIQAVRELIQKRKG